MKRPALPCLFLAWCWLGLHTPAFGQLRIVNYNVNASDSSLTSPRPGMSSVLSAINASAKGGFARPIDILVLEEANSVLTTGSQFAALLNTITGGTNYVRSTIDGNTTGSGRPICIYNSETVKLLGEQAIGVTSSTGQPRQTLRYQFEPTGYDASSAFYVYASHFKASNTATDVNRRNVEAIAIRADADALGDGVPIISLGDLNLYTSTDKSFQTLTGSGNAQFFDPINSVGSWTGNSAFSAVHTQSPATTAYFGGQVTGGINDRFDFQLTTGELLDGRGMDCLTNSYWAFGNTNTHSMNGAVTTGSAGALAALLPGYSTTQASDVLTYLSQVTDHLPVVADYQIPAKMTASIASIPTTVIKNASVSTSLSVSNSAPVSVSQGADRLDYTYTSSGLFAGSGTGSDMALGGAQSHVLSVSTTQAGLRSGTVSVTATSPQAASPNFSQPVTMSVLDHSIGSFAQGSTVTGLTIDFGTLTQGTGTASQNFSIFNRPGTLGATWTAKLDLDTITPSVPGVFSTTMSPFTNLASGSSRLFGLSMLTTTTGYFSGTYSLGLSDENLPGATNQSLSLTVIGRVASPANTVLNVASGTQTQLALGYAGINGTSSITKTGSGTVVLDAANTNTGSTTVSQGRLQVSHTSALASSPVTVQSGGALSINTIGTMQAPSLTITGSGQVILPTATQQIVSLGSLSIDQATGGRFDIGKGRIEIAPGGITETELRADLVAGRGTGNFHQTNTGIVTSAANPVPYFVPVIGYNMLPSGATVIAWSAFGDTNLDGSVDFDDVVQFVAANLYDTGLPATWAQGDYDYNGVVDFDDVVASVSGGLFDTGSYLPGPLAPSGMAAMGGESLGVAAVPEPSTWAMVAGALACAGRGAWRRRKIAA